MTTQEQIKKAIDKLAETQKALNTEMGKAMTDVCLKVQKECQVGMTNTKVNNKISYGKRKHHPSLPAEYPAVDNGDLRRSITFEVEERSNSVKGKVGSTINNPPYPVYLEYGTSRMQPRPWLRPSIEKSEDYIRQRYEQALKDSKK